MIIHSSPTQVITVTVKPGLGYTIGGGEAFAGNYDSGGTVYTAASYALIGTVTAVNPEWADEYGNAYGSTSLVTPAYPLREHLGDIYVYMFSYDTMVGNF